MSRVCVITGGARGIGACLARSFAANGYAIALIDRLVDPLQRLVAELQSQGYDASGYVGDLADERVLNDFVDSVLARHGKVDCLINNACMSHGGILSGCDYEQFDEVLRVGVLAPYWLTYRFRDHFTPQAAVLNIASTRAFQSQADTESYTAAKGGIVALTHALAVSLSGKVRVNAIAPGWIDTGFANDPDYIQNAADADRTQHPSGRIGRPDDIARAALFLCDPANAFINGEVLRVDGGMARLMVYHADHGWQYAPADERASS